MWVSEPIGLWAGSIWVLVWLIFPTVKIAFYLRLEIFRSFYFRYLTSILIPDLRLEIRRPALIATIVSRAATFTGRPPSVRLAGRWRQSGRYSDPGTAPATRPPFYSADRVLPDREALAGASPPAPPHAQCSAALRR